MEIRKTMMIGMLFMGLSAAGISQSFNSDYKFAIGLRAGYPAGLTFKFNTAKDAKVELIAGFWTGLFNITALYEKNVPAFNIDGMNWYFGGGGHITFLQDRIKDGNRWYYNRGEGYAFGIDGVVGLEYKIPPIPFAISMDLKPTIEIDRNSNVYFGIDPGLGLKFTF